VSDTPLVLISSGEGDADFLYASGMPIESGLYIRFTNGDDVLVASPLEIDRARMQSKAARKMSFAEAGYEDSGPYASWARLAVKLLRDRGHDGAHVSPHLQAAYLEELRAAGLEVGIDMTLFEAERRRKTPAEAHRIGEAQQAAEAALKEVVQLLGRADVRDRMLARDGQPLTSEWLYARASLVLAERGYMCPEMIIAGSPENAMPHYRGEGQIRAGAPVIIDIFPTGRSSHYNGDLTRTVVVGKIPEDVRRMHAATLQAQDAAIETIRAGVSASDVHRAVCQVLVDRGFGTTTAGYEGADGGPKMNHSTGHGVGLEIHEEPGVRAQNAEPLEEGNVITVEPGLYLMGMGGVRVEDTGMVTAGGFQNFTTITRSLDPKDYV
jgi:Xaa-Pro aminopeptidase